MAPAAKLDKRKGKAANNAVINSTREYGSCSGL